MEALSMARPVRVESAGGLRQHVVVGPHRLVVDEPPEAGGGDAGPTPVELLLGALGA
jgi:putative redox protein